MNAMTSSPVVLTHGLSSQGGMVHARSLGGKGMNRFWGSGHLIGKGLVEKEPVADVGLAWRQLSLVLSWLS